MRKTKPNLEELTKRSHELFQVSVYQNQYIGPLFSLYAHWHEEIEFIYVTKGRLVLHVRGESIVGYPGDIFMINSKEIHSIAPYQPQEESSHHAIVWHLDVLRSFSFDVCQYRYIEPIQDGRLVFPTKIELNSAVNSKVKKHLLAIIKSMSEQSMGWELVSKAALYNILISLIVENQMMNIKNQNNDVNHYKYETVKRGVDHIHQNFSQKISVSELARLSNLNRDYFIRLFKESVGQTPIEYLNVYRIEQAARLLLETNQTVLDISLECGFENNSYFIKRFKEQKGITPKQFQKKAQQYKKESLNV